MEETVQALLEIAAFIAVISVAPSLMWSTIRGKPDPWLFLRKISKFTGYWSMKGLRGTVKLLNDWSNATWRRAQRRGTRTWVSLAFYALSFFLGLAYYLLVIPTEIIGSASKV